MGRADRHVRTGVERLCADPGVAGSGRFGLVTNYTGVMPDLRMNIAALREAGIPLVALFGPEHGLRGTAQAGGSESDTHDPESGLRLYDTYRCTGAKLDQLLTSSGVDTVLYDLQDIGSRFYTYVWTMYDLMLSAARTGIRFVVLDRPNPLTGRVVEGPLLDPAFASFVGRAPIPLRHGLTVAELARHLRDEVASTAGAPLDLETVPMDGYHRGMYGDQTGLDWVMPSVNIPTLETALVYPGTGLFEGTTMSEGRGTTRPFELIGAPWVDGKWAASLNELELPGVRFRDACFNPAFHKHAGDRVRGVQLHLSDRDAFQPVRTAVMMVALARSLYPSDFEWRPRAAETGPSSRYSIDLLWGSDSLRKTIDADEDPMALVADPSAPGPRAWVGADVLMYPDELGASSGVPTGTGHDTNGH